MAVTIAGLSKTYPNGVKALNNIALTIGNNMFGLVGPNGAGKSTSYFKTLRKVIMKQAI
jgi:ABC-2 type transport system ATP-binding protein